jgi:hypothetical protein
MPRVIGSENLQKDVWFKFIRELLEKRVSNDPEAKPVFQDIGEMTFQFVFNDRKDLSYWQEYDGEDFINNLPRVREITHRNRSVQNFALSLRENVAQPQRRPFQNLHIKPLSTHFINNLPRRYLALAIKC